MNLPVFLDEEELASLMHVDTALIKILTKHQDRFYKRYEMQKANGGIREIRQPSKDLKGIQAWILRNILDKFSPSPFATAYRKGMNVLDNVLPHFNNRYFICLDIKDFFPSISIDKVVAIFLLVGYSKNAALILANLCTCENSLPQGAVTSPSLSNLVAAKLDRRIAGFTSRRNIIYTRYADDITLSSNNPVLLNQSLPTMRRILKSEDFRLNEDKLRVLGPRKRCLVTGLVKDNSESRFGIGRINKRHMRAVMHHCLFNLNRDEKYQNKQSVIGWLNYLKGVDEKSFEQMNRYWEQLNDKVNSSCEK